VTAQCSPWTRPSEHRGRRGAGPVASPGVFALFERWSPDTRAPSAHLACRTTREGWRNAIRHPILACPRTVWGCRDPTLGQSETRNGEERNMRSWLRKRIVWAGALAVLFGIPSPTPASGQVSERLKVIVLDPVPRDGAEDDFGKDLGKMLRELIDDFDTHRPLEEKELKETLKRYGRKLKDLNCVMSLQLARQGVARIVFCGSYTENRQERTFSMSDVRFAAPEGSSLEIPDKTWSEDDVPAAAREIAAAFKTYVEQLRHARYCGDFYTSGLYDDSERTCRKALEITPDDPQVRLVLAQVMRQTDRLDEAYAETVKVLELDPENGTALQLAGFLATSLGRPEDEARAYYATFLDLNPGNVPVRLKIAYELAQAGDPEGAMLFVEEGLAIEPANTELLLQHASFAIKAGLDRRVARLPLPAGAAEFIRKGLDSYQKAYETLGPEMNPDHLYRMIGALSELAMLDRALELTGQVLETHGEEARFWAARADVLNKLGRLGDALLALDTVEARDSSHPNLNAKRGQWLLEAEREEEALPLLREAVERGEQPADVVAAMLFGAAVRRGIDVDAWGYAVKVIEMAKTFDPGLSERMRGQLDFYHAYALYRQAVVQQEPQNSESARLTLPKFNEVARLLGLSHVITYAREKQSGLLQQLSGNNQEYIKIQEAVLRVGN